MSGAGIWRSAVFLACVVVLAGGAAASDIPSQGRLTFDVLRDGQPFGRHEYVVQRTDAGTLVREQARFSARIGPLTVFRFEHECAIRWVAEALTSVDCSTLKDGRRTRVVGAREGAAIVVRSAGGVERFAADTPLTLFLTPAALKNGAYLDTETGQRRALRVRRLGAETIAVGGQAIAAERYRVEGTLSMELWYDSAGRWVQGAFMARGQRIEYRLASPLSAAPT